MLERSADVKFVLSLKNGDANEKNTYHIDYSRVDSRNLESSIKRCWNYDSSAFHFRSQRRHDARYRQRDPKQWSRKHCRWSQQRRESLRQRLYQHIAERIDPDAKYRWRNIGRSPPPVTSDRQGMVPLIRFCSEPKIMCHDDPSIQSEFSLLGFNSEEISCARVCPFANRRPSASTKAS